MSGLSHSKSLGTPPTSSAATTTSSRAQREERGGASLHPEQVRHRTRMAEGEQGGVNPVLQRRAVLDQVQPPPGPLAISTHRRRGQPDRRDEITPRELGQNPSVDSVFS